MRELAEEAVVVPEELAGLRRFPLDGALLLFDRERGLNAHCEGPETVHLRQQAPRVVQFGVTNRCNLSCGFCSRDRDAASTWSADDVVAFASELAEAGVLEIAFGGGEPWAFPDFAALVRRLYEETPLAINFTTNGLALTAGRLDAIDGYYGQLRLSLYDDNDWRARVALLVAARARFGVNYLVTPERVSTLASLVLELAARGCSDVLLLSYNGHDPALHLSAAEVARLRSDVMLLARGLRGRCTLKLDVCWGERVQGVPRLFERSDCGAGRDFVVLTSDRKLMACSFHHDAEPVASGAQLVALWREQRERWRLPSSIPGCARLPDFGLAQRVRLEVVA